MIGASKGIGVGIALSAVKVGASVIVIAAHHHPATALVHTRGLHYRYHHQRRCPRFKYRGIRLPNI